MTPAETLAALHLAGGQLRAEPGGALFVDGISPTDLHPGILASLRQHKAMLHRYVSAFPGGCWPCEVVPIE